MTKYELVLALCKEAGDREGIPEILEGFVANHINCCVDIVENAAHGDVAALIHIRACLGLSILT